MLSPATPYEGADDLLCAVSSGFDADGDSISYNFSWLVDGVPFGGAIDTATSGTVPAMNTFKWEVWQCSVTATDGIDNGPVVSASVTIDVPWAGLITFSNCGQTGRSGPTQSMCDLAYAGEPFGSGECDFWVPVLDSSPAPQPISLTSVLGRLTVSGPISPARFRWYWGCAEDRGRTTR